MDTTQLVVPGRACLTCKFFTPPAGVGMGECHRFPPTLFSVPLQNGKGEIEFHNITGFAQVTETMWCGEHKPKII